MKESLYVYKNNNTYDITIISEPVKLEICNGGVNSFSINAVQFKGKVTIQVSLNIDPTEDDWYNIYEREYPSDVDQWRETSNIYFSYIGRFRCVRAIVDKSMIPNYSESDWQYGYIDRILLKL